ncbi:MAG: hypothetical protein A2136_05495 [Chloroflexi bacterium RBG_16_54_11]|nr:MAG: hypothetical protein A2136_05495 [Chloroflexi bacterium RBG_16_54_11]
MKVILTRETSVYETIYPENTELDLVQGKALFLIRLGRARETPEGMVKRALEERSKRKRKEK